VCGALPACVQVTFVPAGTVIVVGSKAKSTMRAAFGAGAVRDVSGSFDTSLWALFGTALLMAAILAPLTTARLRPVSA